MRVWIRIHALLVSFFLPEQMDSALFFSSLQALLCLDGY